MASRQEEKERRRREREEAERAASAAAGRRKRIGMVVGGLLSIALVAGVVVAIAASTGGDDGNGGGAQAGDVKAPTAGLEDLNAAAKAADCTVKTFPSEGRDHVKEGTELEYETNPPTSGPHFPVAAEDGIYEPGNSPEAGAVVHSLEHGRINFQYAPGTPQRRIQQLEALFNEEVNGVAGYHSLLFENQTGLKAPLAATAWTQSITCPEFSPAAFDALRAFRERYVDKGPEFVP